MSLSTKVTFTLNNGKRIPALGLGTVPSEFGHEVKDQVITAVKAGYRHIDTAWYYGVEMFVGEALKELFSTGVVTREDIFVTTKVWPTHHDRPEESLDASLKDLGLDYVDLLLQHWPLCFERSDKTDPDGKLRSNAGQPKDADGNIAYADDPDTGVKYIDFYQRLEKILDTTAKVKSIGVSNYTIERLEKLLPVAKHVPVVNQIEYHPQLPQQDLVKYCEDKGILIEAYSPVGSDGAGVLKIPLVQELAEKYDVTTNEIAIAYHILQGRIVLPRSSNLERIKTIIRLPKLTEDELARLYKVGEENPKRYIKDVFGSKLGFKWW